LSGRWVSQKKKKADNQPARDDIFCSEWGHYGEFRLNHTISNAKVNFFAPTLTINTQKANLSEYYICIFHPQNCLWETTP